MNTASFISDRDNQYLFDDIVSEHAASGDVSRLYAKIKIMIKSIHAAHEQKIILSDIESYQYEDDLDQYFNRS